MTAFCGRFNDERTRWLRCGDADPWAVVITSPNSVRSIWVNANVGIAYTGRAGGLGGCGEGYWRRTDFRVTFDARRSAPPDSGSPLAVELPRLRNEPLVFRRPPVCNNRLLQHVLPFGILWTCTIRRRFLG